MGHGFGFELRHMHAFECSLCKRLINDKSHSDAILQTALFGALKYHICPNCLQQYEGNAEDKRWRKRVDKWMAKRYPEGGK